MGINARRSRRFLYLHKLEKRQFLILLRTQVISGRVNLLKAEKLNMFGCVLLSFRFNGSRCVISSSVSFFQSYFYSSRLVEQNELLNFFYENSFKCSMKMPKRREIRVVFLIISKFSFSVWVFVCLYPKK